MEFNLLIWILTLEKLASCNGVAGPKPTQKGWTCVANQTLLG